jgi:hypothetical protein
MENRLKARKGDREEVEKGRKGDIKKKLRKTCKKKRKTQIGRKKPSEETDVWSKIQRKKKGGRDINQVIFKLEGTVALFQQKVYAAF